MILGITGGSGSGKTTLLNLLRQEGALVLDCDAIYHDLLNQSAALNEAIASRFPQAMRAGSIDRKALAAIVFQDSEALQKLNAITHSAVKAEVLKALEANPPLAAIDAIALFESGLNQLCHVTVAVTAPMDVRVARLMARDGISHDDALRRIRAQQEPLWYRQRCDYLLENTGTLSDFQKKCLAFLRKLAIIPSNK